MITTDKIRHLIEQGMSTDSVEVSGGEGKYTAEVVSQEFNDLNLIKRHKLVYACVNDEITSGALHALTIVAKTPEEVS
ncbi:MAG: BolA family transcriptional regulator [Gammaproteobacteria bacterium]|nr:BolA family transcriptional regulator [Gammaproteobacteria bacterium]